MNCKKAILGMFFLVTFGVFSSSLQAQINPSNGQGLGDVCNKCAATVYSITPVQFPGSCSVWAFGSSVGGSDDCEVVGYSWTSSDPSANIFNAGGHAKISFSATGLISVCLTYTKWFDSNGNGIIDPGETCEGRECVTVDVCP